MMRQFERGCGRYQQSPHGERSLHEVGPLQCFLCYKRHSTLQVENGTLDCRLSEKKQTMDFRMTHNPSAPDGHTCLGTRSG
jgi:hypothetical protein